MELARTCADGHNLKLWITYNSSGLAQWCRLKHIRRVSRGLNVTRDTVPAPGNKDEPFNPSVGNANFVSITTHVVSPTGMNRCLLSPGVETVRREAENRDAAQKAMHRQEQEEVLRREIETNVDAQYAVQQVQGQAAPSKHEAHSQPTGVAATATTPTLTLRDIFRCATSSLQCHC